MKFSQPRLDPRVQSDMSMAYATVGLIFSSMSQGAMFYHVTGGGLIPAIREIVLLFLCGNALRNTEATESTQPDRLAYLAGVAFFLDSTASGLLDLTWRAESIEFAFVYMSFALVLASFSLSSFMFAEKWLIYLGGTICSFVLFNLLLLAVDLTFSSDTLLDPNLCTFLLVFAALIAFGSSKLISECERGSGDYMTHALRVSFIVSNICAACIYLFERAQQNLRTSFANRSKKKIK